MKYHIVINTTQEIETVALNAKAGKQPAHVMWEIGQVLKAKIHQPINVKTLPEDKVLAKIIGFPEYWALARKLSKQLNEDDVIYCDGELLGIPMAKCCSKNINRPKIAVLFHNINRPRGYLALNLLKAKQIDLFITGTASQTKFLRKYLSLPDNKIYQIASHPSTDTAFFTPTEVLEKKDRPIVASGGLEKRDYQTLANATSYLNVDVKICAFSPNRTASKRTFPKVMPKNMTCNFYQWYDLLQLYRNADLVVLPLLNNNYQAGLSTLFEAMACKRPIVITRSPKAGIINTLIDSGVVTGVKAGDSVDLKQAIETILNNPEKANNQAQLGYEFVLNKHNQSKYIQDLATKLISIFGQGDIKPNVVNYLDSGITKG